MTETLRRPAPSPDTVGELVETAGREVARFERLTYAYPGTDQPALDDIQLGIQQGLTVVAGGSGSGKSSLLRVLNGLIPHFHGGRIRGDAVVAGTPVLGARTRALARLVGFVFQDPESQFVYSTVAREVGFGPENLGLPRGEISARVEEALAAMRIEALGSRAIATLSGGERQRVALASALAMQPAILALDEPTSQLDPAGAEALVGACIRLAAGGTSLVVAEHRLARLLPAADRLVLMEGGRVAGAGAVRELAASLPHPPQVVELARRLGWQPTPLTVAAARPLAPALTHPQAFAPAPAGDMVWEARGLTLAHGARHVLEATDLSGAASEVVVLMGDNGSGKTTLLRAIAGLHRPAAGEVRRILPRGRRAAYLPQDPTALLHRPTLRAEIELTLARSPSAGSAGDLLAELGLAGLADRYPRDLSGGERQRAAIAAILAGAPGLALLDEPTRGMDGDARAMMARLVGRLRETGAAVVLATHDSELAAEVGDRIVRLDAGRASDLGPPELALRAGRPGATDIAQLYPGGPVTVEGVLRCL